WYQSWYFLRGLLLGVDALDVRCGCRQCRVDVGAGGSHGRREEHAMGTETERSVGSGATWMGRANFAELFLVINNLFCYRHSRSRHGRDGIRFQPDSTDGAGRFVGRLLS